MGEYHQCLPEGKRDSQRVNGHRIGVCGHAGIQTSSCLLSFAAWLRSSAVTRPPLKWTFNRFCRVKKARTKFLFTARRLSCACDRVRRSCA